MVKNELKIDDNTSKSSKMRSKEQIGLFLAHFWPSFAPQILVLTISQYLDPSGLSTSPWCCFHPIIYDFGVISAVWLILDHFWQLSRNILDVDLDPGYHDLSKQGGKRLFELEFPQTSVLYFAMWWGLPKVWWHEDIYCPKWFRHRRLQWVSIRVPEIFPRYRDTVPIFD